MKKSYTVNLGSQLQFEGTLYACGATVALTDEQAAYPLASGCITECPQPAPTRGKHGAGPVNDLDLLVPADRSSRQAAAKP